MAGTITKTSDEMIEQGFRSSVRTRKIVITFTGDAADGSVPALSIPLDGFIMKLVTNPGTTQPTDNWDLAITDADGADVLGGTGVNRDTLNTETIYPTISGATIPAWCIGTHSVVVTGNSVNSATGTITIYLKDTL